MNKKYLLLLTLGGFIIALDQLTKLYVHTHFDLGESITVIRDYFDLTYVRNQGAAFGIFRDANESFRTIFFLSMPPICIAIILMLLKGLPDNETVQTLALTGVFGGAIGNYIDRIRFGYVVDFLDFHLKRYYTWPAFNVADIAIVCGVCTLLFVMVLEEKNKKLTQKTTSKE